VPQGDIELAKHRMTGFKRPGAHCEFRFGSTEGNRNLLIGGHEDYSMVVDRPRNVMARRAVPYPIRSVDGYWPDADHDASRPWVVDLDACGRLPWRKAGDLR
jgi:hypothetical protein